MACNKQQSTSDLLVIC